MMAFLYQRSSIMREQPRWVRPGRRLRDKCYQEVRFPPTMSSRRRPGPIPRDLSIRLAEVPNDESSPNSCLWLWVPAFAGTTAENSRHLASIEQCPHSEESANLPAWT